MNGGYDMYSPPALEHRGVDGGRHVGVVAPHRRGLDPGAQPRLRHAGRLANVRDLLLRLDRALGLHEAARVGERRAGNSATRLSNARTGRDAEPFSTPIHPRSSWASPRAARTADGPAPPCR